jgi:flavin-dependent dehydrogenase
MEAGENTSYSDRVDVIVVGAGPAGGAAARGLALAGARVLLVDKARFPRWKVCGCCLNGSALQTLEAIGIGDLPRRLGARRLDRFRIAARGQVTELALPTGAAVSRVAFDHALIETAIAAGVAFCPATSAAWVEETTDSVQLALRVDGAPRTVRARVVIAADGLTAGFTRRIPGARCTIARHARIGAGAVIDDAPSGPEPGVIQMAVGSGGYVGSVRLEDDGLNVAAAFDVAFIKSAGGLAQAAAGVLDESGMPFAEALRRAQWRGTPPLTRRYQPPALRRLFLVGDAAEYVEPFTGEGIAWALSGGAAVVSHVLTTLRGELADAQRNWSRCQRESLGRRMRQCRWIAGGLRHPRLTGAAVRLLRVWPGLADPYIRRLNRAVVAGG